MKYLSIFLISLSFADQLPLKSKELPVSRYQIYQMDKDSDISTLKSPKNYLKNLKKKKNIPIAHRDKFLKKYISKYIKTMDDLDRDIFVKTLSSYPKSDFIKKYKKYQITDKYTQMKKDLGELL